MFISSNKTSTSSPVQEKLRSDSSTAGPLSRDKLRGSGHSLLTIDPYMAHSRSAKHLMGGGRDSAGIPRSAGSDASGSHSGFKPSVKLGARMEKLEKWRIHPSSIKSPKDPLKFHGGHATVSKAFLPDVIDSSHVRLSRMFLSIDKPYKPREYMRLCRQSPGSNDHIREAADDRRDAQEKLGEEKEEEDDDEHGSDSDYCWWGEFVAVKKARIGDNKDLNRVLGLALRETEFLVELSHPNIIELKGFVEDLSKDIIWLVFPWAENGNLKDFVASQDWEIPERISLITDVAKGLDYLHNQKVPICHGDLKSLNVLVNSKRVAVISDFGSARRLTDQDLNRQPGLVRNQQQPLQAIFSTLSKTITLTGNIYTLRWAAPELLNDDQMSLWSDIWALGWITYEVLTNSIPFQDVRDDANVVERVIKGDFPSLNEHARVALFQNLCSLMTMCWNHSPSERPTATAYVLAISDMPMVVPRPYSMASSKLSFEVLIQRGRKGKESGDSAMAFTCFTEALRISTKIGDRKGRVSALQGLTEVHWARKEYSEAIERGSEVLKIYTDVGDMHGKASALWSLAEMHRLRHEYNEAIALRSERLQIRIGIYDRRGRADALWRLAEVHRLRNKYSEAIMRNSEALQIYTDIGDRNGQASALSSLAQVHQLQTEYDEANKLYSEALQIYIDIGDRPGQASALSSLAQVHRLQNEYDKALKLYCKALQICPIDDGRGIADARRGLAELYRLRDKFTGA